MIRHECPGIRPQPLGSYLAGLGLVRVIGEQADPAATARWADDGLIIDTTVADLAEWLVTEYVPTPVLSPWNGGSGFGAKDKEPKRRLKDLLHSKSPRLDCFRQAIATAQDVTGRARDAGWIKADDKGGEKVTDKGRIVQEFRNRCPESLLLWIDAAVVLTGEQPFFPPLLGTGGNDGRLDFSTNFHQRLLDVIDDSPKGRGHSLGWARDLLAGSQAELLNKGSTGQFDPAAVGGQASSPFGQAESLVNPWAYILLTEGALLFAAGTARRHQHAVGRAAVPFTVRFSPDGSDSGAAGESKTSRGEVWAPVWNQPCTLAEIRQLFGEARASWRGKPAQRAVEFYAATRTLGVARGLSEFVRYGIQQRNGLAFVAVPVATVRVRSKPEVRLAARVEDWVSWIGGPDTSSAAGAAVRAFDAAHLAYARDGGPRALAEMLAALTALEQAAGRSGRLRERLPVRRAPAADDFVRELAKAECTELRVAVGIASCSARGGAGKLARTMRHIVLPIDPDESRPREGRWRQSPLVPGYGLRPLRQVLADVLIWRSRTAADQEEGRRVQAAAAPERARGHGNGTLRYRGVPTFRSGVPVPAEDAHAFARGLLDEGDLDLWLRACLALDWRGVRAPWAHRPGLVPPVPTLGVIQPLAAGLRPAGATPDSAAIAMEPDWASRLAAGQVRAVHTEAVARLRQAGWEAVPFQPAHPAHPGVTGTAIAAALVLRCQEQPHVILERAHLGIRHRTEPMTSDADPADQADDLVSTTHELAEELS
jgi:CRISPR-associated protein Csx17